MTDPNSGPGWYAWFKMPANTSHVAYVHETGKVFDPEHGWNPPEFALAAAEGNVHRLVRADDADVLAEALSDLLESEGRES